MEKTFTVVITVTGDGTETKEEELIAKVVAQIGDIRASLGNLQLALTITEQE